MQSFDPSLGTRYRLADGVPRPLKQAGGGGTASSTLQVRVGGRLLFPSELLPAELHEEGDMTQGTHNLDKSEWDLDYISRGSTPTSIESVTTVSSNIQATFKSGGLLTT